MERRNFWEQILESQPSDKFVCAYGGPIAQQLEINRGVVDKFLDIASLDGRVLVKDSNRTRKRANPDINPDGSITAKSVLKWGEKPIIDEKKDNIYFQVEPDPEGWVISLNGKLIQDDLVEKTKNGSREVQKELAGKLNYSLRVGLKEALLKDKLTTIKDPYLFGRVMSPICCVVPNFIVSSFFGTNWQIYWGVGCYTLFSLAANWGWREMHNMDKRDKNPEMFLESDSGRTLFNIFRRTVESNWEIFAPPLEIDRTVVAYSYLDYQLLTRNPLLRLDY